MMTTANWITVVLALVGIVANVGWLMLTRFIRSQDELRNALTGEHGAVARLHQRIDKLGDTYQTRETAEMQFEHLKQFIELWKQDSERRHQENLKRFEDLRAQQDRTTESVKMDVRSLREHLDEVRSD